MAGSVWLRPVRFGGVGALARKTVQALRRLRTFRRDTSGVAALEFSLIAVPFFLTLYAVFEISITYVAGGSIQDATNATARMIRTGQVKMAGMTAQQFKTKVCEHLISPLLPCNDDLKIDVRRYTSFAEVANPSPLNAQKEWNNDFQFNIGKACDIVLVRVFYKWPIFTPVIGTMLSDMKDGSQMLQATAAVRNEPFGSGDDGCGA